MGLHSVASFSGLTFSRFKQWLDFDQAAEGANALHSCGREREI